MEPSDGVHQQLPVPAQLQGIRRIRAGHGHHPAAFRGKSNAAAPERGVNGCGSVAVNAVADLPQGAVDQAVPAKLRLRCPGRLCLLPVGNDHFPDCLLHLFQFKGLGQVGRDAVADGLLGAGKIVVTGQEAELTVQSLLPDVFQYIQSILAGHSDVADNQFRFFRNGNLNGRFAVIGLQDPADAQRGPRYLVLQDAHCGNIIITNQKFHGYPPYPGSTVPHGRRPGGGWKAGADHPDGRSGSAYSVHC